MLLVISFNYVYYITLKCYVVIYYVEHMRAPSPIIDHHNTTDHEVSLDNFSIVGREDNSIARNIKEAMFIRVNDPSLNRNIGKFQLPHIWDEVLARSPELQLK